MTNRLIMLAALSCAVLLPACGGTGGDTAGGGASSTGAAGGTSATAGSTESAEPTAVPGQGVPEACELTTPAELGAILGADLGTGRPARVSPDRSTCMYANGTITAVEIAANFYATRDLIEAQGRKTEDLAGLGQAAYYDPAGQVVARGDQVFVAVTAFGVDVATLQAAAAKLLEVAE